MPFVLKKQKPRRLEIASGSHGITLLVEKIRVDTILNAFQEHMDFVDSAEDARLRGEKSVKLPLGLMRELKKILLESAVGWEGVFDEDGNAVAFSIEHLDELISYDLQFYMSAVKAVSSLYSSDETADAEKNSSATSTSAIVH